MSNSSLVSYTRISPNKTSPRNHVIDTITIHCYVGQVSVEDMGSWLCNPSAQASANYGIGKDGRIGMYVEEKDRSWCSSNRDNDNRAVTIECASDAAHPYAINEKVYTSLIRLCADICKRNGIKKLVWSTDKNKRVNHLDGCNMTVHRDYAAKACPGDFIYNRLSQIAADVNTLLSGGSLLYRVRLSWEDPSSQTGAYTSLEYAKADADKHQGFSVYGENGKAVYTSMAKYCWTTKNGVKIRTGASSAKAQVNWSPLIKGEKLEILQEKTNKAGNLWYQVKWNDKSGWIWSKVTSMSEVSKVSGKARQAAANAKVIAADNSHGYNNTKGARGGNPDYACSSFVADCYIKAGVSLDKAAGKVYTKDMRKIFTKHGFADVSSKVNLKTGAGVLIGDVLVKPGSHTEICVGDGKLAGARGNANSGKAENGKAGDQTGAEIAVSKYYNFGQTICLRYAK